MRRIICGVVAATVLVACGGGTRGSDVPPGQYGLGHGETVAVHVLDPMPVQPQPGMRNPVDPGTRWVGVHLEYFNPTDQTVSTALSHRVELHTADGLEAQNVGMASWTKLPEIGDTIPPHGKLSGWMAFVVPTGDRPDSLILWGQDTGVNARHVTVKL